MKIKNIAKLFVVLYVYDRQSSRVFIYTSYCTCTIDKDRACLYTRRIRVASYYMSNFVTVTATTSNVKALFRVGLSTEIHRSATQINKVREIIYS